MVRIRLSRRGANKRPFYRIVVTDSRKCRDGRPIEYIGFLNPIAKEHEEKIKINLQRIDCWLKLGAKMSSRVTGLVNYINKKNNSTTKQNTKHQTTKKIIN